MVCRYLVDRCVGGLSSGLFDDLYQKKRAALIRRQLVLLIVHCHGCGAAFREQSVLAGGIVDAKAIQFFQVCKAR